MTREELLARITVDARVCGGRPCIAGTRIWVSLILDMLAAGVSESELLREYPQLNPLDIRAAVAYGAELARAHWVNVGTDADTAGAPS